MRLDFLGTGSGNFRGSRRIPSSALLDRLLLDCGAGATGRLHDLQAFDRVDAILISHLHSDHIAGLFDFLLHTLITGRKRPLTVVAPPGLKAILSAVVAARGTVIDPAELYEFHVVEELAPRLTVGPWTVRGVPLDHTVPNLGYDLRSDGLSVFYTGDTREPSGPSELKVDILIHEATFSDEHTEQARELGHSTGSEAARAALRFGARKLFLNHVSDRPGIEGEILGEARKLFPDSTVVEDRQGFDL
jgi:ribonuclease Z